MIKISIKKDSKIVRKSFVEKKDLLTFLNTLKFYGVVEVFYKDKTSKTIQKILADKIWDMNVGSSEEHSDYVFAIVGKSPYHNTEHGKQMYGS
tara:strand:+ start:451 stop:729 length:279 start_codon:yes stop_codon:yes gene_type:complete